jgi:hypothetical protein
MILKIKYLNLKAGYWKFPFLSNLKILQLIYKNRFTGFQY